MSHQIDIESMSRDERLALLEELWDSLDVEDVPITDAQRAELDRRLDTLDRENAPGLTWEAVVRAIQERRG